MPVQHIQSPQEFRQLLATNPASKLIVVDFFATWCGPCRMIAPTFEELSNVHRNATFVKVDTDKLQQVAQQCKVRAMPTFQFYKGSQKVDEFAGANPQRLQALVQQHNSGGGGGGAEADATAASSSSSSSAEGSNSSSKETAELTAYLDKKQVVCLNQNTKHPWANLFDGKADTFLESDVDEQLLLELPFNQSVKVLSLKLVAADIDSAPKKVKLFVNRASVGFEELDALKPVQEFTLAPEQLQGEAIPLRYVLFQNVNSLVFFIESNQGEKEVTRLNSLSVQGTPGFAADMSNIKAAAAKPGEE